MVGSWAQVADSHLRGVGDNTSNGEESQVLIMDVWTTELNLHNSQDKPFFFLWVGD